MAIHLSQPATGLPGIRSREVRIGADRRKTLHKFAPDLIEVLEFRAARAGDPMLAALQLLIDMHRSAKREVPPDAPMPFRKDWRHLVSEGGQPNRCLYETAVLARLRDKLRSGDIWVERSSSYRRFDSYLLPPNRGSQGTQEPQGVAFQR